MLELRGVSKSFGSTHAIPSLDLVIPAGRTTVLIGPSGCGKSTLLRLMIGLIQPDAGTVSFEGTALTTDNVSSLRHRMGYVIQDGGLFPHLTAQENIELLARHLRWDGSRIASRLSELVELTHFPPDALTRFPVQLSGGQRQRVSLMRALMLDPHVLLLDEPLGALDPMVRSDLQAELKSIFDTLKKTVVLVTHDMGEAGFFGNPILLLRDGGIVQQGTLAELVTTPSDPFVTRFVNAQRSPLDAFGSDAS
jgi:osmoprotectant transport system ATP-binding protein